MPKPRGDVETLQQRSCRNLKMDAIGRNMQFCFAINTIIQPYIYSCVLTEIYPTLQFKHTAGTTHLRIIQPHVSAVSKFHHQAIKSTLKEMIEFNTIRCNVLKLAVKGGRITVVEVAVLLSWRWPYYCRGGLHQISLPVLKILTVGLKIRETRKIATCQKLRLSSLHSVSH